ncbi:TIGR03086 family metal-binding protein [Blastococcus litoris]|uniref:TIGR03086 family metal-binding protein n=1 Tax=Blastococcus litoris TaxID=2171622 RepID=UPI000E307640|nr:TIGR03086 family metal-binding protein [Blastococcus litoris]
MTTTTSLTQRPLLPSDPRPDFGVATGLALATLDAVPTGRLSAPTPCDEFDVRALLGHVLGVLRRITAAAGGVPAVGPVAPVTGVPDDGWSATLGAAVRDVEAAWADPAVLDREMQLPFGTMPGAAALAGWTAEISTHTWDLAAATGQTPEWDEAVLGRALDAVRRKLPTPQRPPGVPFGDAVPVPDGAPVVDQLVAWQGRDPHWQPST